MPRFPRTAPALLLLALGCASSADSPQTPASIPPTEPPSTPAGATARSGDLAQSTLARYRIRLDPVAGCVSMTLPSISTSEILFAGDSSVIVNTSLAG